MTSTPTPAPMSSGAGENASETTAATAPLYHEEKPLPLLNALRNGAIGLAVVLALGIIIGGAIAGLPGVWGALLGGLIAGVFELVTVVVVLLTRNIAPVTTMTIVMGSWLLKILVVLAFVAFLKNLGFYDRGTFVAVMATALVVVLAAETWGVKNTQVTYVTPASRAD